MCVCHSSVCWLDFQLAKILDSHGVSSRGVLRMVWPSAPQPVPVSPLSRCLVLDVKTLSTCCSLETLSPVLSASGLVHTS